MNAITKISSLPSASELMLVVATIKSAIMRSRYLAAKSVNKRAIALYFHVGEYINRTLSIANWGDSVIDQISALLQQEIPGLTGFAPSSIRKMRSFFNTWKDDFEVCSLTTNNFIEAVKSLSDNELEICSLTTNKLSDEELDAFMSVGFNI